ncbi:MAG: hypothetical protein R2847_10185 [Bacteroidia bacterium]
MLSKNYPEVVDEMKVFEEYIQAMRAMARRTFYKNIYDVQPICYLDLGYVIWGEDYKRGTFLLHAAGTGSSRQYCGNELPDNISNILTLFTKTNDRELLDELAVKILIRSKKMIAEFEQAKVDLKIKVLKRYTMPLFRKS